MAVFSKRTVLILLAVFVLISLALRYPLVEHERYQTDSYYIHLLSDSIIKDGSAAWVFHPLSYFGYFPFSYPSGVPFVVSEFSMMSGLSIEYSVLVLDMIIALLFCLGVFMLARQFVMRPEHALFVVFFAILGARFIDTSYWDGSARAPMIVMITLSLFVVLRANQMGDRRLYGLALIFCLGCLATHHMAVLLILFAVAYMISVITTHYIPRVLHINRRLAIVSSQALILAGIFFVSFIALDFFGNLAFRNLKSTSLFDIDPPALSVLLNMAASYTNQVGFILPIALIGLAYTLRYTRLTPRSVYPMGVLIAFVPILGNTLYVSMIIAPFVAILGVQMIERMIHGHRYRRMKQAFVIVLIVATVALPIWSVDRWNNETFLSGDKVEVSDQVFNDAAYLRVENDGNYAIANVNTQALCLSSLSRTGFLGSGIYLTINGDVTSTDVLNNVTWQSSIFPSNLYKWFEYPDAPNVDSYARGLMVFGLDYLFGPSSSKPASDYFATHSRLIVVVDTRWTSEYVTSYSILPANFPSELQMNHQQWITDEDDSARTFQSYAYYSSGGLTSYLVQLPY